MSRVYFNLQINRVVSWPSGSGQTRIQHFNEQVIREINYLFLIPSRSYETQQLSFYSDKNNTLSMPATTTSYQAYTLLPGAPLEIRPLVRVGFDFPDSGPTSSSSALPAKEALLAFLSSNIKTLALEIEAYSLGSISARDTFINTLSNLLPIMVSSLPAVTEDQPDPSNNQSIPADPNYPAILESTRKGLEDAFLDISDTISEQDERATLLAQAMRKENSFTAVSDINVRLALQLIHAFWHNTNNAAINFHGYNVDGSLSAEILISNTQRAIQALIAEQVTPIVSSSVSEQSKEENALDDELYLAACQNRVVDIHRLIAMGANPNIPNRRGWTPLFAACRNLKVEAVGALLSYPAVDVNVKTTGSGATPLMTALDMSCQDSFKHAEIIDKLIARGANVHIKNNSGQNAIQLMEIRLANMREHGWDEAPRFKSATAGYKELLVSLAARQVAPTTYAIQLPSSSSQLQTNDDRHITPGLLPTFPSRTQTNFQPTILPSFLQPSAPPSLLPIARVPQAPARASSATASRFFSPAPRAASQVVKQFFEAVLNLDTAIVDSTLSARPELLNERNLNGETALLLATKIYLITPVRERKAASFDMILSLLSKGADFHIEDNERVSPFKVALNNEAELDTVLEIMLSFNSTPSN